MKRERDEDLNQEKDKLNNRQYRPAVPRNLIGHFENFKKEKIIDIFLKLPNYYYEGSIQMPTIQIGDFYLNCPCTKEIYQQLKKFSSPIKFGKDLETKQIEMNSEVLEIKDKH